LRTEIVDGALFRVDPRTYFGEISADRVKVFKDTNATGLNEHRIAMSSKQLHALLVVARQGCLRTTILGMAELVLIDRSSHLAGRVVG